MTLVDTIIHELHRMPQNQLMKVLEFVTELSPELAKRQRKSLAVTYGSMNNEQGEVFEAAVLGEEVTEPEN